jgi:ubiquinone/menaquinone biosynthesis C-methylase UbiE
MQFEYMKARRGNQDLLPMNPDYQVAIYNQNLSDLVDIPDKSVDYVVSLSALEHNPPGQVESVVAEVKRVIKPGGALVATMMAAEENDWWHEPSSGMCYTEASLRRIFGLDPGNPSNFKDYNRIFESINNSTRLRENLARFYFESGDNGMPWGKWDPQYVPVGVYSHKP